MKVCSLAFTMYIPARRVFKSTVGSVVDRTKRPMQLNRTTGVVNLPESYRRIGVEVFIDCSYEGDFMAKAGVSYAVGHEVVDDVIGWAAYMMDSHNCDRLVVNGVVKNEGNVEIGGFPPYPISYRALVSKRQEMTNLVGTGMSVGLAYSLRFDSHGAGFHGVGTVGCRCRPVFAEGRIAFPGIGEFYEKAPH